MVESIDRSFQYPFRYDYKFVSRSLLPATYGPLWGFVPLPLYDIRKILVGDLDLVTANIFANEIGSLGTATLAIDWYFLNLVAPRLAATWILSVGAKPCWPNGPHAVSSPSSDVKWVGKVTTGAYLEPQLVAAIDLKPYTQFPTHRLYH